MVDNQVILAPDGENCWGWLPLLLWSYKIWFNTKCNFKSVQSHSGI